MVVAAAVGVASCFGAPISGKSACAASASWINDFIYLLVLYLSFSHLLGNVMPPLIPPPCNASHVRFYPTSPLCSSTRFLCSSLSHTVLLWSPPCLIFWSSHLAVYFSSAAPLGFSTLGSYSEHSHSGVNFKCHHGNLHKTLNRWLIAERHAYFKMFFCKTFATHAGKIVYFKSRLNVEYFSWEYVLLLSYFLALTALSAPVGVLFSVEVMCSHFSLKHYCPCFFSAACGALTFRMFSVWSGDGGNVGSGQQSPPQPRSAKRRPTLESRTSRTKEKGPRPKIHFTEEMWIPLCQVVFWFDLGFLPNK